MIFLDFLGSGMQIEVKENAQQLPLIYLTFRVQREVSNKECVFKFCCPQIVCKGYSWIKTGFT